jgi:hypothetical protein
MEHRIFLRYRLFAMGSLGRNIIVTLAMCVGGGCTLKSLDGFVGGVPDHVDARSHDVPSDATPHDAPLVDIDASDDAASWHPDDAGPKLGFCESQKSSSLVGCADFDNFDKFGFYENVAEVNGRVSLDPLRAFSPPYALRATLDATDASSFGVAQLRASPAQLIAPKRVTYGFSLDIIDCRRDAAGTDIAQLKFFLENMNTHTIRIVLVPPNRVTFFESEFVDGTSRDSETLHFELGSTYAGQRARVEFTADLGGTPTLMGTVGPTTKAAPLGSAAANKTVDITLGLGGGGTGACEIAVDDVVLRFE